jgi:hypothetical protein
MLYFDYLIKLIILLYIRLLIFVLNKLKDLKRIYTHFEMINHE